ncbi:MAG: thermonuclease family protein [Methylocystis sp.]
MALAIAASGVELASLRAQQPAKSPVFDIPQSGVTFQTGDTWSFNGQTFRLYGVQSCIRGTFFTNAAGRRSDCGEASVAYLAALVRDTKPRCTGVAQAGAPPVIFTVCAVHVGANTLDLGTVLITQGFAFAATDMHGGATKVEYAVAEHEASKARRGLWTAPDLPHPSKILIDAARAARPR